MTEEKSDRYKIVGYSQSAHCCFSCTIVDTTKPIMIGGEHYIDHRSEEPEYEPVCECFDEADAELIVVALNEHNRRSMESYDRS
jgi:hypothetical protein